MGKSPGQYRALLKDIGYHFQDGELLERALSHCSTGKNNNERLEFLGDAVLSIIISTELFQRFPKVREGQLSRMRSRLVKGETLAEIALELSLGEYLILGPGELKSGGHRRASILADALEALIGAIYIETGSLAETEQIVLPWYHSRLDSLQTGDGANKDPKTRLQELLQSRRQALPEYQMIDAQGEDHQQSFAVTCRLPDSGQIFHGQASSRRAAEKKAAAAALEVLADNTNE